MKATWVGVFLWVLLSAASAWATEQTDYQELQSFFTAEKHETVIEKGREFESRYPKSDRISQLKNLIGLSYYMTRKSGQAIIQFNQSLDRVKDVTLKPFIQFNLASAQYEGHFLDEASQTLALIQPNVLDKDTRSKYHLLKARILKQQGAQREAIIEAARSMRYIDEARAKVSPARELIEQGLSAIEDPALLDDIYQQTEDTFFGDLVMFRLATRLIANGKNDQATTILKRILARSTKSEKFASVTEMLRTQESQGEVSPNTIGILLPMNGKYAALSQRVIQAVAMGLRIFNPEDPDSQLNLVIADSGEDADQALKGLNDLCLNQHAIAVIGPLLSKGLDQVSQRAQELGVPLLTLTQQDPPAGEYTFSFGITPQVQAQQIAKYAIERLKYKRFAILYPRDKYGEQYSQNFWDAVESMGGKIVGVESYPAEETDFRKWIDRLVGVYYADARKRELDDLEKQRTELNITKKTRKTEKYFLLPPIIDFDAVFIPDEPKNLGQVVPTFAYRDVEGVKFLGTAAWHSQELLTRAQNSVEGALFVDAFHADAVSGLAHKFVDKYKATYGQAPGSVEALAYDASSVLVTLLQGKSLSHRVELKDKLSTLSYSQAVTGRIIVKGNEVVRTFPLFTVKSGRFEEISQ